eukprot:EG_transcript_18890
MDIDENPYEILGIAQDAQEEEIKKVYRKLALSTHPDKRPDMDPAKAQKEFQRLHRAYELLLDCAARKAFDAVLSAKRQRTAVQVTRSAGMDAKRRKLATELEEREREASERQRAADEEGEVDRARERLRVELERLRKKREEDQLRRRMALHDELAQRSGAGPRTPLPPTSPTATVTAETVRRKEQDVLAKLRAKVMAGKAGAPPVT